MTKSNNCKAIPQASKKSIEKNMIKSKMSDKNWTNDVSVICKGRSYLVYNQN
jgi:hypothetical protein